MTETFVDAFERVINEATYRVEKKEGIVIINLESAQEILSALKNMETAPPPYSNKAYKYALAHAASVDYALSIKKDLSEFRRRDFFAGFEAARRIC